MTTTTLPAFAIAAAAHIPGRHDITAMSERLRDADLTDDQAREAAERLEVMQWRCRAAEARTTVYDVVLADERDTSPTSSKGRGGPRWALDARAWIARLVHAPFAPRYWWTAPGTGEAHAMARADGHAFHASPDFRLDRAIRLAVARHQRAAYHCLAEWCADDPSAHLDELVGAHAEALHRDAAHDIARARFNVI